ncbi:DUF262 domain-containing protein [Duganella dendranthematis]|uniref:DUF262 domain-containing protein n=1 Tax=Duganella dendranthematis TaxID=2728021 RepID=A0ABX6MEB7_9BURK|nr:DUF262 domain-containing protein [Duganella dendranthematis]QJD92217.1 DUF262 domain-containing protein [Duganella dendranthematis]
MNDKVMNISYSEPSIQYLQQILDGVSTGLLRVPRFQRPFIWLEDRQLELMRSIREGVPIGAIMIWKTTDAPVAYYKRIGRFPLGTASDPRPQQYILDGVQRICTLYGALINPPSADDVVNYNGETEFLDNEKVIYFSFPDDDFVFSDANTTNSDLMPLNVLFKTLDLIKFQRKLEETGKEEWIEQSSDLAVRFRDYKIPLLSLTTDDLTAATSTFQRINSQGARMSDIHMIHALTWKNDFDLQDQLINLKAEYLSPLFWDDLDDDVILKVCKGLGGLNLYKTEPKEVGKLIRDNPELLRQAFSALANAARIFDDYLGIPTPEFVPYSFQTIFLAIGAHEALDYARSKELIKKWFWFTTYIEAFSGMSDDKVKRALADFKIMVKTSDPIWSNDRSNRFDKKTRFDFRSVRSKATTLALAKRFSDTTNEDSSVLLRNFGRAMMQQLQVKSGGPKNLNSTGNRIFSSPEDVVSFRTRFYSGSLSEVELVSHFLTSDDFLHDLLSSTSLIETRAERIFTYEEKLYQENSIDFLL